MTSNVQEFLDFINEDYNKTKNFYKNLLMERYIEGNNTGLNFLLDNLAKMIIRRQYKPDVDDLTFEFNLESDYEANFKNEIGNNEFRLTIANRVLSSKIKFPNALPKERADKLITLAEKYFANKEDVILISHDAPDIISTNIDFDFEKYRAGFIEQLKDILDNFLQQKRFEFETVKSNKGVVITVTPDYYNLDTSKAHVTRTLADFMVKMDFLYDNNTYLSFATDIIASMTSYMTGATSGRIKGDYELKIPIHYNASRLGQGLARNGDGIEIKGRALYEGFTKRANAFTTHLESILSDGEYQITFEDNGDYSWYFGEDKAKLAEETVAFELMQLINLYCNKNRIPAKLNDKDGLTITINNADVTE